MKKIYVLMTICALALSATGVRADELTVADGTGTSAFVPTWGAYADTKGAHTQFIYPASDLTAMAGQSIQSVTFFANYNSTWSDGEFRVKLMNYSMTELPWDDGIFSFTFADISSVTSVYDGELKVVDNKMVVTFSSPFELESGMNLLIDIEVTKAHSGYTSGSFYGVDKSAYISNCYSGYSKDAGSVKCSNGKFIPKALFSYGAASECVKPTDVVATTVEAKSATLNWSCSSQVQYILVKKGESVDWAGATLTSDASKEFTDLLPLTEYDFYIRSYCDEANQSAAVKVQFKTEKSCFEPKDLAIEEVTGNSAKLKWNTSGSETNFQFVVVKAGETPDWSAAKESGSYLEPLDKLNPTTSYDVYVRAKCGEEEFSDAEKVSFKTECGKIISLPWEDDFSAYYSSILPDCWTTSGDGTAYVFSGALMFGFTAAGSQVSVLPEFGIRVDTLAITFKYNTSDYDAQLQLGYINVSDEFVVIGSYPRNKDYAAVSDVKLAGIPEETRKLAFRYNAEGASYVYIDNIKVHVPEEDVVTGADNIHGYKVQSTKVIENGILYLIYNGTKYDVQGKRIY